MFHLSLALSLFNLFCVFEKSSLLQSLLSSQIISFEGTIICLKYHV